MTSSICPKCQTTLSAEALAGGRCPQCGQPLPGQAPAGGSPAGSATQGPASGMQTVDSVPDVLARASGPHAPPSPRSGTVFIRQGDTADELKPPPAPAAGVPGIGATLDSVTLPGGQPPGPPAP